MFNITIPNLEREINVFERMAEINFRPADRHQHVAELFNIILIQYGYKYNPFKELFVRNALIPSGGLNYIPEVTADLDGYLNLFTNGTMYEHNGLWIGELLESIYAEVSRFYKPNPYNFIEFELRNGISYLYNRGDIRSLRYQEAVEWFEIQQEINSY